MWDFVLPFEILHKAKTGHGRALDETARYTCPAMLVLGLAGFFHLLAGERNQGNVTRLFHGLSYDPLMFCTRASLAARADVAFFSNIFSEKVGLFVINCQGFICAELAELRLGKETAIAASL